MRKKLTVHDCYNGRPFGGERYVNDPTHQLADLVLEIEAEMRTLGLWEEHRPPAEALASSAPFCFDTLEFTQWIQWILLPRVVRMLEQQQPWPQRSEISPLAEESFKEVDANTDRLLKLMSDFDALING
jgi:uncharacterized protein YqcC (DUF446 family)